MGKTKSGALGAVTRRRTVAPIWFGSRTHAANPLGRGPHTWLSPSDLSSTAGARTTNIDVRPAVVAGARNQEETASGGDSSRWCTMTPHRGSEGPRGERGHRLMCPYAPAARPRFPEWSQGDWGGVGVTLCGATWILATAR